VESPASVTDSRAASAELLQFTSTYLDTDADERPTRLDEPREQRVELLLLLLLLQQ